MANTITVSNAAQLSAALSSAGSGDTILLAGGDYGRLYMPANGFGSGFSAPVTIAAADPGNPPEFSGLDLRGVSNLTFREVTFDYTFQTGDPLTLRPFNVSGGGNLTFQNSVFNGDTARGVSAVADGYGTGVGLSVSNATGVRVEGSEFSGFWKGALFSNSSNLVVAGNDISEMRSDGLNFSAVQGALVEGNTIRDFRASPNSADHRDMLQVFTQGTNRPTTDLVIRGNTFDIGTGDPTQSIWMRNEVVDTGRAGSSMYYQRITIEDNVIVNSQRNGIAVGETAGLTIRSNSVLRSDGGNVDGADTPVEIPLILVASRSTGVTITQNATAGIGGYDGQAGWTVTRNAIVQDQNPFGDGWYGDVFTASSLEAPGGVHRFVAVAGSVLDTLDAGAPATLAPPAGNTADAAFQMTVPVVGDQTRIFDASYTTGPQPAGTTYLWTFGDGATATGKTVAYTYQNGGTYDVTLTVRTPDGRTDSETLAVEVDGDGLVRLEDSGLFAVYAGGEATLLGAATSTSTLSASAGSDGVQLGAAGVTASIARSSVASMLNTDDVTIAMTIEADRAGAWGEVVRLGTSFSVVVDGKGAVVLQALSDSGQAVKLSSGGVRVNDTAPHDIEVRLEGGRLQLWVDDRMADDTAFAGTLSNNGRLDMTFGNPWGRTNFNGDRTAFEVLVNDGPGSQAFTDDPFTVQQTLDLAAPLM